MNIIGWIILGGFAGWIASLLMGSRDNLLINIIIGIIGAFVGGFLFSLIGGTGITGFNLWSMFVAVIGAVVLIAILRALRRNA